MKKIICLTMAVLMACTTSVFAKSKKSTKKSSKIKVGIAKIVQHPALDDVEKGVMDVIKESGLNVEFDNQNANGDVGTAAQIANQFKSEKVDVAVW